MAFTAALVDPGPTPSLGVAVEVIGGKDYQAIKLVDGVAGSENPVGVVANPLHVLDDAVLAALAAGIAVTGPATDAQLRATPLPVTGPATDTQLRATPLPTRTSDREVVASLTGAGQSATLLPLDGMATATIDVSGTFVATGNLEFTIDGTVWFPYFPGGNAGSNAGVLITSGTTFNNAFQRTFSVAGLKGIRVRVSAFTSGTMVVVLRASSGVNVVQLGASLPQGSNPIGWLIPANSGGAPSNFSATTNTTIFNSSSTSKLRTIMNDSDQDMLVNLSAAAVTTTIYTVRVKANGGFFATDFSGQVQAMMVAAIGTGTVTIQQMI